MWVPCPIAWGGGRTAAARGVVGRLWAAVVNWTAGVELLVEGRLGGGVVGDGETATQSAMPRSLRQPRPRTPVPPSYLHQTGGHIANYRFSFYPSKLGRILRLVGDWPQVVFGGLAPGYVLIECGEVEPVSSSSSRYYTVFLAVFP